MRNYIILNGVNSNTITGLLISTLPPITKPKIRTQTEEIDGRDGDIVTKLGYSAYDKEFEIGLYGDFDIDDVIAYFNSEGTVTFSNEPDKYYNYQILDQIDYEKLIRFKKAKVRMHVQPFKYPLEETPVEITTQTVNDEGEEIDLDNTEEAPMTIELKGNTSQEITTGKNLFSGNYSQFDSTGGTGTTYDYFKLPNDNKQYTLTVIAKNNFTATGTTFLGFTTNGGNGGTSVDWVISQGSGTITKGTILSKTSTNNRRYISLYSTGASSLKNFTDNFYIQLEEGSQATSYEPYTNGASPNPDYPQDVQIVTGDNIITIENSDSSESQSYHITLPEGMYMGWIGDYQDNIYNEGDKWYIEKNIGKYTFTGAESFAKSGGYTTANRFVCYTSSITPAPKIVTSGNLSGFYNRGNVNQISYLTNYTSYFAYNTNQNHFLSIPVSVIPNWQDSLTDSQKIALYRQYLVNNECTICYVLETPTTTEITDETLIAQLEALANATSYYPATHITQTNDDKPFILNATAFQFGEATVNNEGNIYSKPTLDIEGSGTVGIYLEGNQIFSIDLSNSSECVIDTTQLEAYNPTTSELMNRQVTGDYSNFKLNAGDNQVQATGEITKVTISNYTRWL